MNVFAWNTTVTEVEGCTVTELRLGRPKTHNKEKEVELAHIEEHGKK